MSKIKKKKPTTKNTGIKKDLSVVARVLVQKIKDSGLHQGWIAEKIGVDQRTLSMFVGGRKEYVTQSMCNKLAEFFKDK